MLPMAFPVPMPYCAVISYRREEEEECLYLTRTFASWHPSSIFAVTFQELNATK
jgi:hypothetical protein